jgi:3-deoxy-manno-octulosonate cytidylyltransferase (CMP-KDO synthetase)
MKNAIVIPARLKSSRLKNKLLIEVEGKSVLQYTVENAMKSTKANRIIVATEDLEIKRHIDSMKYGIECIKTPQYNCGTERVKHIVKEHLPNYEKVINLQADEPMFRSSSLDDVFDAISSENAIASAYAFITDKKEYESQHVIKLTMNVFDMALYFSRSPIPFGGLNGANHFYKHIGTYGFYVKTLMELPSTSNYQKTENLEQLAWLENGYNIKMVRINYPTIGIDVLDDIKSFKEALIKV